MMHHAQIAQRVFNTPLMVDPAKALAFLSGLGPAHHRAGDHLRGLEVDSLDQLPPACPPAPRSSAMT
jgi:hypothetical protein